MKYNLTTQTVFAQNQSDVQDLPVILTNISNNIFDIAGKIITPIAIVMLVLCGIQILIADNPQTVSNAKRRALYIFIGYLIVKFAPSIIQTLQGLL